MHGTATRSDCRYSAFLSYSHADARDAAWLQRRLETYRLPKARRAARRLGSDPRRLKPVFRDSAEMAAAPDLDEALLLALAQSDCLIVICTPEAAASKWVAREIEAFSALYGRENIIAALFRGEPATAFPPGLSFVDEEGRYHEPVAADFRREGEGKRLALLKLVARLATIDLDALIQRDANRRTRRLVGLVALAALVAAALGVLAWVAVRAQQGAEAERAKAERLVDFMLGDLRDKLRPVGRLDVMASVNEAALSYYQAQDLEQLPEESLARRARLLRAAGEDDQQRGNLSSAMRHFKEARRATSALLAANPKDATLIFDHAHSEGFVGLAQWDAGDIAGASASFARYAALAAQLRAIDPTNVEYAREQGNAATNLGVITLRNRGDGRAAQRLFETSLEAFQSVRKLRPGDIDAAIAIADAHGWIADSLKLQGRMSDAKMQRERERAMLAHMIDDDGTNQELRAEALGNQLAIARIEADEGLLGPALERFASGKIEAGRLSRNDPQNNRLKTQKRMFELLALETWLKAPPPERKSVPRPASSLGGCDSPADRADSEVEDLCRVLSWREGESNVRPNEVEEIRLRRRHQILSSGWGIDFVKILNKD